MVREPSPWRWDSTQTFTIFDAPLDSLGPCRIGGRGSEGLRGSGPMFHGRTTWNINRGAHIKLGDSRSIFELTSIFSPLGSMLNFEPSENTTSRHQRENRESL